MAAQQVGIVSATKGEVFARNAEGQMRRLSVGDPVLEGDVIITAAGSSAEITPFNGPALNVAEQQTVALDGSVVSGVPADASTGGVSPLSATEAARVIQQPAAGNQDFNTQLEDEAAAAGLTGGGVDGGHSFVNLLRIVEGIDGVAYDFPINTSGTAPTIEGDVVVPPIVGPIAPPLPLTIKIFAVDPMGEDGSYVVRTTPVPEGELAHYVALAVDGNGVPLVIQPGGMAQITFSPGSATEGSDYSLSNTPTSVSLGEIFTANVIDDFLADNGEQFNISVSEFSNAADYSGVTYVGSTTEISDNSVLINEQLPEGEFDANDTVYAQISVDPSSVEEGGTLTYKVTLVDSEGNSVVVPDGKSVEVQLQWTGDASNTGDATPLPASVFISGDSSTTFIVTAVEDTVYESTEPLVATIIGVTDTDGSFEKVAVSEIDTASSLITDNDLPTISIAATDSTAVEPKDGSETYTDYDTAEFRVSLSNTSEYDTTVKVTVSAGDANAIESVDVSAFQYLSGTTWVNVPDDGVLTIAAGSDHVDLRIDPAADTVYEGIENFNVNITEASTNDVSLGVTDGGSWVAAGTIADEGSQLGDLPTISIAVDPTSISEDADGVLTYTISLSNKSEYDTVVTYQLSGAATNGTDYTTNNTLYSVTIPAGQLTATFTVDPTPDMTVEGDETVIATIVSATTNQVSLSYGGPATGTIIDNDQAVHFSITRNVAQIAEGASGATFTITMTGVDQLNAGNTATVTLTQSGSASTADLDHTLIDSLNAYLIAHPTIGVTLNTTTGVLTFDSSYSGLPLVFTVSAVEDTLNKEGIETIVGTLKDATITNGTADIDTSVASVNIIDVVPSAAYFTMNTSNTNSDGSSTGFQNFEISLVQGGTTLHKVVEVADEQGQQKFYVELGHDVVFTPDTTFSVSLEWVSGAAHLNFTSFYLTDAFGNKVVLNGTSGNDNVTLQGGETASYDGVIYTISVNNQGVATASDPIGYDVNGTSLILDTVGNNDSFNLDFGLLSLGGGSEVDQFGAIRTINMSGDGTGEDNTLRLSLNDVLDVVDSTNKLYITGDAGDKVVLGGTGWSSSGTQTDSTTNIMYDVYTNSASSVQVLVEHELIKQVNLEP